MEKCDRTMIKIKYQNNLPYAIIDDLYTDREQQEIWSEIEYLCFKNNKLKGPDHTHSGTITDNEGNTKYKKQNKGLVLDEIYNDRQISAILTHNRKIFSKELVDDLISKHLLFKYIGLTNYDLTKLHLFLDGDHYLDHDDNAVFSVNTYFNSTPKKFKGGELKIGEDVIEIKNNRTVIFPSILRHEVLPVKLEDNRPINGRIAISQFLFLGFRL